MGFELEKFGDIQLREDFIEWLIDNIWYEQGLRYQRLWDYYKNTLLNISDASGIGVKRNECSRNYVQAQEVGLPARITGIMRSSLGGCFDGQPVTDIERKEIVIENDIAWRINAMVDYLFGKGINIVSRSTDSRRCTEIEKILKAVFSANGGVSLLQDMAVLGSVYGFVDCIVRPGEQIYRAMDNSRTWALKDTSEANQKTSLERALQLANDISLEIIEAPRVLPILDDNDYRKITCYVQHYKQYRNEISDESSFLKRLLKINPSNSIRKSGSVTEIIGAKYWQRYCDDDLVAQGENMLGVVPVVHIQNIAQPYHYEGVSDVEPLIPLQDELNTRLSDRANRITFQSFKMYLAKGIDGIEDKEVMPGRMWCTDNEEAKIEEFGGDSSTPSENEHILEIRDAMDKISGVSPVVAGVLKSKIGNLTSAVALRMTLLGMLSKTEKKRLTYGEGIKQICKLILECFDRAGIYRTDISEREVEVCFPNPMPQETLEKLQEAKIKEELGVPRNIILSELGYQSNDKQEVK